jgi:cell division transport system permease protein
MGFTAITTVAITLFIVGLFSIVVYDIQAVLNSIRSQVEVAVYLKDNTTNQLKEYLENQIRQWPEIAEVKYISKDQALERFRAQNEGSNILKEIQGNPLPASFELRLNDPEKVELVALRFIDKDGSYIEGVDEVIFGRDYVRQLFNITAVIGTIALLIIVVLLLAAIVLIFNTIRLSIYARRKEVEVMKLVGATNWYVRTPFLFEGFFEGLIGAGIAVTLLYFLNRFLLIRAEMAVIETFSVRNLAIIGSTNIIFIVYLVILVIGGLIGIISSSIALKKYLNV